jgi:opacity protein-like surface antigen
MLFALLLVAQVAAGPVATCRAPGDSQQRTWILERRDAAWRIVFRSRALDKPQVVLAIPNAQPVIDDDEIRVSHTSANGGRTIEWRITNGPSTLDLYVNHGLEVNVEADLDPAVDLMNTDGPVDVTCGFDARSTKVQREVDGRSEFTISAEVMPIFAQFSPASIYGMGVAPVVWRWNFTPQPRWSAFGELAMGGMWSSKPIPEKTSRGNFTAHWGAGVRLRPRGPHSVVVAYRFQHLSNGNQLGSNPGVNSHVVLVGWSYRWSPPSGG